MTLIFTIGQNRYLRWQKHDMLNNKKWSIDDNFNLLMLLQNGNFVILHPHDECPHGHSVSNVKCKYHHGVRVIKKNTSVSFVFRVSTSSALFRKVDNTVVDHGVLSNIKKDINKHLLYQSVDNEQYHSDIKDAMSSITC